LSTLAIEGSRRLGGGGRVALALRYGDLALLALALPVFIVAGWPMPGYGVAAAAWIAQHGIQLAADRRAGRALVEGERRVALGALAAATLGRVWLVTLAILLVGLAERESGLAAAVLTAALVTVHMGGQFLARLLYPVERG
jgi:hypothetical protein